MANLNDNLQLDFILDQLPNIPHDEQLSQPAGSNACGAYVLTAALAALVGWPNNRQISYGTQVRIILAQDTFAVAAGKVFAVTGILPPPDEDVVPPDGGYNSPAAMAKVACDFGLEVVINVTHAAYAVLGTLYPNELQNCLSVVGAEVLLNAEYSNDIGESELQLLCVDNGSGGLHFIARGSNGLYYDPATGIRTLNWGDPTLAAFVESGYVFSGLWMVISL
ncbi:hypothetical protein G4V03_01615 [Escherichia coli]|nr:hypothetical protein [Escherichia coli]